MLNQEKISLMTKVAVYEKREGKEDKKKMTFFKNDYIIYSSFGVQIGATIALLIIFGFDFGIQVLDNLATITEFDFVAPAMKYLTIWIVIMIIYTIVSAFYNRLEYLKSEQRVNAYQKQLKQLEKMD